MQLLSALSAPPAPLPSPGRGCPRSAGLRLHENIRGWGGGLRDGTTRFAAISRVLLLLSLPLYYSSFTGSFLFLTAALSPPDSLISRERSAPPPPPPSPFLLPFRACRVAVVLPGCPGTRVSPCPGAPRPAGCPLGRGTQPPNLTGREPDPSRSSGLGFAGAERSGRDGVGGDGGGRNRGMGSSAGAADPGPAARCLGGQSRRLPLKK